MELDKLKEQLNSKLASDHFSHSQEDIALLLNKRTGSVVGKLKGSLRFEIICCVAIVLIFGLIAVLNNHQSFRIYFSIFTFVMLVVLIQLMLLLNKTIQLSNTDLPVRHNLQLIADQMSRMVKRYFRFTMLLIPVCGALAFSLGYYEKGLVPGRVLGQHHFSSTQVIVFAIVYTGALAVAAYYLTKAYLRNLYGKYIDQLQDCIRELGEA